MTLVWGNHHPLSRVLEMTTMEFDVIKSHSHIIQNVPIPLGVHIYMNTSNIYSLAIIIISSINLCSVIITF